MPGSPKYIQSVLENVPMAIHLVDQDFLIVGWNKAASMIFGFEPEEVMYKKKIWDCFRYDVHAHQVKAQLVERGKYEGESALLRKDGSVLYSYLSIVKLSPQTVEGAVPEASPDDGAHFYACYVTDIAQRKQMEQELQEYARGLERKIYDRTKELEKANEDLKRFDRLKDDFVANVSHDLRTPLVSAQGYIELMLAENMGSVNEEQRRALTITRRNLRRLIFLIENLLSFSRLRYGRARTAYKPFPFVDLAGECLRDLRIRTLKKNLTIRVDIPDNLPLVDAAEDDIYRVLNNLLSNAEKYTGSDPMIEINAAEMSSETGRRFLQVLVRDNGQGIPPEKMDDIFNRYKPLAPKEDNESERNVGGRKPLPKISSVGIGLPLVKEILNSYGSDVKIESELGKGTEVTFELPLVIEKNNA